MTGLKQATVAPNGILKRCWELIGLCLVLAVIIEALIPSKFLYSQKKSFIYITHPMTDVYYILDIFIRFRTQYIDEKTSEIITDVKLIQARYFRTWFIFDLFLSLPYGKRCSPMTERNSM